MVDAAGTEPLLGDAEAVPGLADGVGHRDPHAVVADLAVGAPAAAAVAHDRDRPDQLDPGVVAGTMIWLMRRWGSAPGSVTAMTIPKAAPSAPG